jgi:hypothetical protein
MANEDEATEAYRELLKQLGGLGADDLVRRIERAVGRGTIRKREEERSRGKRAEEVTTREPFSPTERYVVAVRLVLAALDPLFMTKDARAQLASLLDGPPPQLTWEFDELEPVEGEARQDPPAALFEEAIQDIPAPDVDVEKLLEEAQGVGRLCDELFKDI